MMRIYDRVATVHSVTSAASPLSLTLSTGVSHYCAERTVGASRYYAAQQAGVQLDAVLELPQADISPTAVVSYGGSQYRIVQVQQTLDDLGLPITVLSLRRTDEQFDIPQPTPSGSGGGDGGVNA